MADDAFRVTLRSSDGHDPLNERHLVLHPNKPYTIGRASTNTQKPSLMETVDNAYIHSPVISRNHASLNLRLDPTSVHITDSSSMHGTMVNGTKLKPLRPWKLAHGDVLQFGADVTRNDQYFIARKYTFDAPALASKPAELQPDKSSPRVFAVPISDSEQDDDSDEEYHVNRKSPFSTRSYLGTQANPVTIEDSEAVSQGVVISLLDDDHNEDEKEEEAPVSLGQPAPAPESESTTTSFSLTDIISGDAPPPPPYEEHPTHVVGPDSFSDNGSLDGLYPGSVYSDDDHDLSDGHGPVQLSGAWDTASESSLEDASDMDARTEFEVSDEEDLDDEVDMDVTDLGHTTEEESEQDDEPAAAPSDVDEDEDDNDLEDDIPLRHLFRGESSHRPFAAVGATPIANTQGLTPTMGGGLFTSPVYQPVQSMPQSPERRHLPPTSYRTGPFSAPQYAFGCPTSSLPYGAETTRSRMVSFAPEYVSPYNTTRDNVYNLTRESALYNPPGFTPNPFLEQHTEEITNVPCPPADHYRPPMPVCESPPSPPAQASSESTFAPAFHETRGPTPPHDRSSPQPVRRTKVSIPEIVEDTSPEQPPTPTSVPSVSGGVKRKADEMEEESPEATENVTDDVKPSESSEAAPPSVSVVAIQDRPKKRLRTVMGSAAKMAAYLIPSTAIAVGMLTQLPDAFFQG